MTTSGMEMFVRKSCFLLREKSEVNYLLESGTQPSFSNKFQSLQ